ncbi:MAG: LON peptidase substrate-binding domain-containing protein [Gemmatimonadetes bacterium]|nr:LON peptidase substrate-binding domain-containing protein [Gemmatimonadota bacterium]
MAVQLPIFPLPLVLFPGAPQLLHIFEPRYRDMLADCMDGDRRFGISWIDQAEGQDPAPPAGAVGCMAYIRARTALPDGRSNILTVGEDRYEVREYIDTGRPYRVAKVETFDDDPASSTGTEALATGVSQAFVKFSSAMNALNDVSASTPELSPDPKALSFQVSAAVEVEGRVKQELLALRSTRARLETLERLLRTVTGDMARRAEVHVRARRNGRGGESPSIVTGT